MAKDDETKKSHEATIHIDKGKFKVTQERMTGAELRALPAPPIAVTFDVYLEVSGPGADHKVDDGEPIEIKDGMHFFTAPRAITPGRAS
ncbi:MAG: multiubiquitin domain-containing protein [Solirubrobacteraceae bacterium]